MSDNYIPFIHEKGSRQEVSHTYYTTHKKCPRCWSDHIIQTLVFYSIDMERPELFKDENEAKCSCCGWVGVVHDLV